MTPRIAHVISTPTGFGGAERVLEALVASGTSRGWDQWVFNPFADDPDASALRERCPGATFAGYRCSHVHELPAVRRWLGRELHQVQPDVTHAHLFHASVLCASLRSRASTVLTHHHAGLLEFENRSLDARLDRWAGRRYDRVVAVSRWGQRLLEEGYGYEADSVTLIPNGWDGSPRPRATDDRPPTAICVGNLRPEKGYDVLLRAFHETLTRVPAARLKILGEGELRGALERRAEELQIEGSVEFTGQVEDVWRELSRADVFVLASVVEPLGIAVMEAMAAGLPVVASAAGGIPELVEPGTTGQLVEPGNAEALGGELAQLLLSPERGREMGRAGKQRVAPLGSEHMVEAYFGLYEELRR